MSARSQQWLFDHAPRGVAPGPENFKAQAKSLPSPSSGELLVEVIYASVDPAQISWMQGVADYMPPIRSGDVMLAGGVGRVIASGDPGFAEGAFVSGVLGWQTHILSNGKDLAGQALRTVPPGIPLALSQSVLGTTGLTAYFGLFDVGRLRAGDRVLVTGAAGAVGSVAGQLARLAGAKQVVGVAGGAKKCAWVAEELGFDACIDYKAGPIGDTLGSAFSGPIDVFFDNVGGPALDAGLARIAHGARIVICGGISGYTSGAKGPDNYLQLILRRATMQGFVVLDYAAQFGPAIERLAGWVRAGQIEAELDIIEGFDALPDALGGLFSGQNRGKRLVKLAEDPTA